MMKSKLREVLIHIGGCVTFLALPIVFSPDANSIADVWKYAPALKDFLVYLSLILFFYFNFFFLIPVFYFKRNYTGFFLISFVCFAVVVLLPNAVVKEDNGFEKSAYRPERPERAEPPEGAKPPPPPPDERFSIQPSPPHMPEEQHTSNMPVQQHTSKSLLLDVGHQVFLFLAVFFFSLILKISNRWRQSEKEKLNAELSYLKAQINPHFLFNTLNSIYSLAIDKSDQTPAAIVKLSGMMRYVISDSGHHLVSLSKEIDYINNYIALQKIRFGNAVPLSFRVSGVYVGEQIAPLILISFVENAFKHGVNAAEDSDIRIEINITLHQLHFTAFNNKVTVQEMPEDKGGLGIVNTRKRLELLYPGRHTLEIIDDPNYFSVSLLLQLT
ncbi:Histidine kinase [Chitinophaga sp. YR573]|uniref:sensor histidine kinase n=1 Tax=Chitinophaga sp. YR573 TaxID=1881040 RepID=UPI0008AB45A1|nr:sensor histidine kinase [Chitinophaga sp. YR573]SEW15437.1 Histidine kinase [Chitinophaga sp. YR573]